METISLEKKIEHQRIRKIIDETTEKLKESGALPKNYPNHKKKRPYEVTRAALLAYKELHGVEYQLPEGAIILED